MSDTPYYKFGSTPSDGSMGAIIKHVSQNHEEAIQYLKDRASGKITSLKTPWDIWNRQLTGGLELGTINILGARSGGGKTLTATQITRNAMALNPNQDIAILDLQFEMLGRNTSIRSLSKKMGMSVKKLKSADGTVLSAQDIAKAESLLEAERYVPIYEVNVPLNLSAIDEVIRLFRKRIKKPFIVTLDHALLVKGTGHQKERLEALGEFMTETKKEGDLLWLLLSQLNRSIFDVERTKEFSPGNYPAENDLFGADALLQHADTVTIFDQPLKRGIFKYGAKHRWLLEPSLHKDYIAVHVVKNREGEPTMWWMKLDGSRQDLIEVDPKDYPTTETISF